MAGRPAVWRRKRRDKRGRSPSCPPNRQQSQLIKRYTHRVAISNNRLLDIADATGRDAILSRIIWLSGLEGANRNARL
jgi:hypothetical protein